MVLFINKFCQVMERDSFCSYVMLVAQNIMEQICMLLFVYVCVLIVFVSRSYFKNKYNGLVFNGLLGGQA
jgi:hypothetical protein